LAQGDSTPPDHSASYLHNFVSTETSTLMSVKLLAFGISVSVQSLRLPMVDVLSAPHPRVYVYPLDPIYNVKPLSKIGNYNMKKKSQMYRAEVDMHEWLLNSKFRVLDPDRADLFYVPVYTGASLNFHGCELQRRNKTRQLVHEALKTIRQAGPYWDRYGGRDHVWTFTYDHGVCLDFCLDRAIQENASEILQEIGKSIFLQYDGAINSPCHYQNTTIVIPPAISTEINSLLKSGPRPRPTNVFFRGQTSLHRPDNPWYEILMLYGSPEEQNLPEPIMPEPDMTSETEVTRDRVYSNGVRQSLQRQYGTGTKKSKDGWVVTAETSNKMFEEMASSKFCLAPRGFAAWTVRTFEALALGCIPVIIADDNDLPLGKYIDWPSISVRVHESDLPYLKTILSRLTESHISAKQKAIAQTWPLLSWTDPQERVYNLVMQELADKLDHVRREVQ